MSRTYYEIHAERYHFRRWTKKHVKALHTSSGCRFAYDTDKIDDEDFQRELEKYAEEHHGKTTRND